jgi:hypothetical protein
MQGCVRCASPSRLALCTDPHADQCPVPTDGVALSALQVSVIHGGHELDLRGLLQPGIAGFPPSLMMLSHLTSLVLSQCERTRASSPPPRATSPPLPPPRAATWQVRDRPLHDLFLGILRACPSTHCSTPSPPLPALR